MVTKCGFRFSAPRPGNAISSYRDSMTEWRRYRWYGPYCPAESPVEVRA